MHAHAVIHNSRHINQLTRLANRVFGSHCVGVRRDRKPCCELREPIKTATNGRVDAPNERSGEGMGPSVTIAACPPISVIVPCHDAESTVERALESIAKQTNWPTQAVVVDDASTDGTAGVLRRCAQRRWPFVLTVVTLPMNRGPSEARNAGWESIRPDSKYVAFLDADDVWLPRKLERQIAWMEKHQDVAWTAHRCIILGTAQPPPRDDGSSTKVTPISRRRLLARNLVATPTVVVRASVRNRFRVGWRHCEDLLLWLDWLDAGARGVMLDIPLAALGRVPGTPGGSTADLEAMYRSEQRVICTLATEGRIPRLEAAAWQGYAWLRYQRRRLRG